MAADVHALVPALHNIATRLRIDSMRATTAAGSGHPTSCCSAADLVAALFFAEMRFDPKDPRNPDSDRFVLSKGHAAPLLYAAWAEAGAFHRGELLNLRTDSAPTSRATRRRGSRSSTSPPDRSGQGICAGVGIALNARRIGSDYRTYVLLGDGETAEGSVWEAADVAERYEPRQPLRHHRRQRAGPEPADQFRARHGAVRAPLDGVRLARPRRRRPRHERDARRVRRGARGRRAARR